MGIQLIHSKVQRLFKKKMGQANHFLITILIGLDEVGKGMVKKPGSLDAAWDPKDTKASVIRSREFALNSSLVWIIDNFDAYVQNCKRKPRLIEKKDLLSDLDSADRRVNDKFVVLFNRYKSSNQISLYGALLALGIQWRNIATHSEAKNVLDEEFVKILLDNNEWYYTNFCHLVIDDALDHFNAHKSPSLKETTSIIKAVLRFIELVDTELIRELDTERYLSELFEEHFSIEEKQKDKRALILTLTKERQKSMVKNILLSNGYTYTDGSDGFDIDDEFLNKYLTSPTK